MKAIKEDFLDAYSKGKVSKIHYDLLKEKIFEYAQKKNDDSPQV
jgi:hypothetical protein